MKLYRTTAGFHPTQADAKGFSKDFEQVEVPTDKPGLISFLNQLHNAQQDREDEFTSVYERQDPPVDEPPVRLLSLDHLFAHAPIAQQLRLAVTAIDAAEAIVTRATKPVQALPIETINAIDDELFN